MIGLRQLRSAGRYAMKCPVCGEVMTQENFGVSDVGMNVDVCENGCKGIWFDQGVLRKLDEKNEGLGAALEAALRYPRRNDGNRGSIICPKCSIPMHAHKYDRAHEVNVDECYKCGGFFLDSGELTEIRNHYMSDAEVEAYTEKIVNAVPAYSEGMEELNAKEKRIESIQKFTKFLTVNYWRKRFE
jgi:Zn-finger nucleic acid-binding protein